MNYRKYQAIFFAALLALLAGAVYLQATGFALITLDDLDYTVLNPVVKGGLTLSGLRGIFSTGQLHNFMPVTQLSYILDVEFFGQKPFGFHFTNVFLHIFNSVLLLVFLYRATGSLFRSFFAAALWALHPMRAESVAWVAERSDLLAGFFSLLGLIAYCGYARSRKPLLYIAALIAMCLGAGAKPVVVVFPVLLLIVDYWPLERLSGKGESLKNLLIEKLPFAVVSAAFSALTMVNLKRTYFTLEERGITARLADVATSYLHYLGETFWPVGLALKDRNTSSYLTGWTAFGAGILLLAITFLLWRTRRSMPAAFAGWCWFLVALFPVSGVVPLDFFFVADHFTYLPHMGLMAGLTWGAAALYGRFQKDLRPLAALAGCLLVALSALSFRQAAVWKDDLSLFGNMDRASGGKSALAKQSLGIVNFRAGKYMEAYMNFSMALLIDPYLLGGAGCKGLAAAKIGKYQEAVELCLKELAVSPDRIEIRLRLPRILVDAGDTVAGAMLGLENIRLLPGDPAAWEGVNYLGGEFRANMIAGKGTAEKKEFGQAIGYFREAVRLAPGDFKARANLAAALWQSGDREGARREGEEAKKLSQGTTFAEGVFLD